MKKRAEKILKLQDDVAELKANFDAHKSLSQQNRGGFWLKSRCTGCITYGTSLIDMTNLREISSLNKHMTEIEKECTSQRLCFMSFLNDVCVCVPYMTIVSLGFI